MFRGKRWQSWRKRSPERVAWKRGEAGGKLKGVRIIIPSNKAVCATVAAHKGRRGNPNGVRIIVPRPATRNATRTTTHYGPALLWRCWYANLLYSPVKSSRHSITYSTFLTRNGFVARSSRSAVGSRKRSGGNQGGCGRGIRNMGGQQKREGVGVRCPM